MIIKERQVKETRRLVKERKLEETTMLRKEKARKIYRVTLANIDTLKEFGRRLIFTVPFVNPTPPLKQRGTICLRCQAVQISRYPGI